MPVLEIWPWKRATAGFWGCLVAASLVAGLGACQADETAAGGQATSEAKAATLPVPFARLKTEAGDFLLQLDAGLAPHHVANFVHLASTGFYDGTSFHRIVPGFMIQGGDPNSRDDDPSNDSQGGPTWADVLSPADYGQLQAVAEMLAAKGFAGLEERAALRAEFSASARHVRGTLSMARSRHPDSAGSQFFICVAERQDLDGQYTSFGRVIHGLAVVDAIVSAPTHTERRQSPLEPVRIQHVELLRDTAGFTADERESYAQIAAEAH